MIDMVYPGQICVLGNAEAHVETASDESVIWREFKRGKLIQKARETPTWYFLKNAVPHWNSL